MFFIVYHNVDAEGRECWFLTLSRTLLSMDENANTELENLTGRLWTYGFLLIGAYFSAMLYWVWGLENGLMEDMQPMGPDFLNVWAASLMALKGQFAAIYDYGLHWQGEKSAFEGQDVPYYGWHYPPTFMLLAYPLAYLSYYPALVVWLSATFVGFAVSIRCILHYPMAWLAAAAAPASFLNASNGQNGFLTAGLIGAALYFLDKRPVLAGILIGLLSYKPQFGILIPLILLLSARWQVFISASLTVITLVGISVGLFGSDMWFAFYESLSLTQSFVLEQGTTGWHRIQSVFSAVSMYGGSVSTAYTLQAIVSICAAGAVCWLWVKPHISHNLRCAALLTTTPLLTPYVLDYDLIILMPALAFYTKDCLERGFQRHDLAVLSLVMIWPVMCRLIAKYLMLPLTPVVLVGFLAIIIWRAVQNYEKENLAQRTVPT